MTKKRAIVVVVFLSVATLSMFFLLNGTKVPERGRVSWGGVLSYHGYDNGRFSSPGSMILSSDWDLAITVNEIEDGVKTSLHTFHYYPEDHSLLAITPVMSGGEIELVCNLRGKTGFSAELWTMPVRHCEYLSIPSSSGSIGLDGDTNRLPNHLCYIIFESDEDRPRVRSDNSDEHLVSESKKALGGFITLDIVATRPVRDEHRERKKAVQAKNAHNSFLADVSIYPCPKLYVKRYGQDETIIAIDAEELSRGGELAVVWGSPRQRRRPYRKQAFLPGEQTELSIPIDPRNHLGEICVYLSRTGDAGGKYGTRRLGYLPHVVDELGCSELNDTRGVRSHSEGHFHPQEARLSKDGEDLVVAIFACGHDIEVAEAYLVQKERRLALTACKAEEVGYPSASKGTHTWKIRWKGNEALQRQEFIELYFKFRNVNGEDWVWYRYSGISLQDCDRDEINFIEMD